MLLLILLSCKNSYNYYGINNYGKLTLYKGGKFKFFYFNDNIDSGCFIARKDTIILNSNYLSPVRIKQINQYDSGEFVGCYFTQVEIFDKNGCLKKTRYAKFDTLRELVKIDSVKFSKGDIVNFSIIGWVNRKILWNTDTINSGYVEIDTAMIRRVYFKNFPLIKKGKFLIPFEETENKTFRLINDFELLPFVKGRANKKYNRYFSGFGPVY